MPKGEIYTCSIVKDALEAGKRVFVPYIHKGAQSTSGKPSSVMDMVSLHSLEDYENLESDPWGIPTPSKASISSRERCLTEIDDEDGGPKHVAKGSGDIDMIIIPAIAFDRTFGRLGHGKGYYDFFLWRYKEKLALRSNGKSMPFLSKSSPVMKILRGVTHLTSHVLPVGLSLNEQLLAHDQEVPRDATDWLLDAVAVGDGSTIRQ